MGETRCGVASGDDLRFGFDFGYEGRSEVVSGRDGHGTANENALHGSDDSGGGNWFQGSAI